MGMRVSDAIQYKLTDLRKQHKAFLRSKEWDKPGVLTGFQIRAKIEVLVDLRKTLRRAKLIL